MSVKLKNVKVTNVAGDGIMARGTEIQAENLSLSNIARDGLNMRGGSLALDGFRADNIGRNALHLEGDMLANDPLTNLRQELNLPNSITDEEIRQVLISMSDLKESAQADDLLEVTGLGRWALENSLGIAQLAAALWPLVPKG